MIIRRRFRLLLLPSILLAFGLSGAGTVLASDHVALDATVVVAVSQSVPGSDLAGPALAGAHVTLVARLTSQPDVTPVQQLATSASATGIATFSGVARSTDPGDPVLLTLTAQATALAPDGPCTATTTWTAVHHGLISAPAVSVELVGHASVTTSCPPLPTPPGVALDADLVVTVTSGSGIPIPGSEVTLTALADGLPFHSQSAPTDDEGEATFTDVPRPIDAGGATEVILALSASRTDHLLVDGCTFAQRWSASDRRAATGGAIEAALVAQLATSVSCPAPGPGSPVLVGFAVDQTGDPVEVVTGWIIMSRADGARWVGAVGAARDGIIEVPVHAWGTDGEPAEIELRIFGRASSQRIVDGCTYDDGPLGALRTDVILADGFDPDPVTVVTSLGELSAVCGVTATPPPGAPSGGPPTGPGITLPPTDATTALAGAGHAPLLPALVAALGVFALLLGWALVERDA